MATKILYVIGNLDVGGAERHLTQILPALVKLDFAPTVYTLTHKGKLAPVLEASGINVVEPFFAARLRCLPSLLRKPVLLPLTLISLLFLLLRLRPSVVHFFLPAAYLLGGLCSIVANRHIRIMSRRSLNRYQLKYPVLARIERWLHTRMDAVLGNSKAVTNELLDEGVSATRLGLIYNGINLAAFDALSSGQSIRQQIGVSNEALLMVCVANLIPYKGHADLIQALGTIHSKMPGDWIVAIVGRDCGIQQKLQQLAVNQGISKHILWLGERSDTAAIYSAADIGLLCSHEEGFSNSVLEGMAARVAMVVTDVGGNAEAVLDGQCGLVVPAHNPNALGQAILTLSVDTDTRQHMANAARKRIEENFSLAGCVRQYAGLYRALLREPGSPVQDALDTLTSEST